MKYNISAEWIRVVLLHIEEQGESILEAVYDFVIFFPAKLYTHPLFIVRRFEWAQFWKKKKKP